MSDHEIPESRESFRFMGRREEIHTSSHNRVPLFINRFSLSPRTAIGAQTLMRRQRSPAVPKSLLMTRMVRFLYFSNSLFACD
jgi:hypothetical protein